MARIRGYLQQRYTPEREDRYVRAVSIGARYSNNIRNTRSYQNSTRAFMRALDNYDLARAESIRDRREARRYSRNAYMGLGAKG